MYITNIGWGKTQLERSWIHVVLILSTLSSNACLFNCSCSDESWAMEHNVSPSTTAFHDYLISIYWAAATTTTVGYGDVSAHTVPVRC